MRAVTQPSQGLLPNIAMSEQMMRVARRASVYPLVILGGRELSFDEAVQLLPMHLASTAPMPLLEVHEPLPRQQAELGVVLGAIMGGM